MRSQNIVTSPVANLRAERQSALSSPGSCFPGNSAVCVTNTAESQLTHFQSLSLGGNHEPTCYHTLTKNRRGRGGLLATGYWLLAAFKSHTYQKQMG